MSRAPYSVAKWHKIASVSILMPEDYILPSHTSFHFQLLQWKVSLAIPLAVQFQQDRALHSIVKHMNHVKTDPHLMW